MHFSSNQDRTKIELLDGLIEHVAVNPGLYDSTPNDYAVASTNVAGGSGELDYEQAEEKLKIKRKDVSLRMYVSRYNQVYNFVNLMRDTASGRRFDSMLDIGCGYGIQPRIVRALGLSKRTTGIDLYDRASSIHEKDIPRQHRRMKLLRPFSGKALAVAQKPAWDRTDIDECLVRYLPEAQSMYYNVFGRNPGSDIYRQRLVAEPILDEILIQNLYDLDRRFELITSFSSVEWFQFGEFLKKVSNLLEDDGYFYMWWPNWWAPVTPSLLSGHFPWASQRLTPDEFTQYIQEFFADRAAHMSKAYDYFDPGHPTIEDYFRTAAAEGLVPVAYEPIIHPLMIVPRKGVSYRGWGEIGGGKLLLDTLADIQRHRPDVGLSDMMCYGYAAVFHKVSKGRKPKKADFDRFLTQDHRVPQDGLPFLSMLRPLAKRFFLSRK